MKTIGLFLGVIVVVALAIFGYQKFGDWQDAKLAKWKARETQLIDSTRAATLDAARKDTIYLRARTSYVGQRARVISSGTATPRELETIASCDEVQRTCDERHAADTLVAHNLRAELAHARAKPSERAKRFTLYGAGLYDLMNAAPVFRAGADLRILGPISGMAEGEMAIPSAVQCQASKCGVAMRALVGVKYVF